jgi:hypothetical protein
MAIAIREPVGLKKILIAENDERNIKKNQIKIKTKLLRDFPLNKKIIIIASLINLNF